MKYKIKCIRCANKFKFSLFKRQTWLLPKNVQIVSWQLNLWDRRFATFWTFNHACKTDTNKQKEMLFENNQMHGFLKKNLCFSTPEIADFHKLFCRFFPSSHIQDSMNTLQSQIKTYSTRPFKMCAKKLRNLRTKGELSISVFARNTQGQIMILLVSLSVMD